MRPRVKWSLTTQIYVYWFNLRYLSAVSKRILNFSSRNCGISPLAVSFLLCLNQLSIRCSSIRCFDGLRWLVSIKAITWSYCCCHFSSCVILQTLVVTVLTLLRVYNLRILPCIFHSAVYHLQLMGTWVSYGVANVYLCSLDKLTHTPVLSRTGSISRSTLNC